MKTIAVVTTSRADYGILVPVLRAIQARADLRLRLIVAGAHLAPEFGLTWRTIEADGFAIDERVELLLASDTPEGIAASMGLGVIGFGRAFARRRPDILLLVGDRFETHAAATAALPHRLPVAHVHGGELSFGAIDDALRHAITKLSHLHFVATEEAARRVRQMGEEAWRVTVTGAPALDLMRLVTVMSPSELAERFDLEPQPPILVTYHPVTLEFDQAEAQITQLLEALATVDQPIVFTQPNADTNGRVILERIEEFVEEHRRARLIRTLGSPAYFSLMAWATAMVGNSSSGLLEAPSFELPVVNIGTRQAGRLRAPNVIDVGYSKTEILEGLQRALTPQFRQQLVGLRNPYGDGRAADRIVDALRQAPDAARLISKRFADLAEREPAMAMR